MSFVDLIWIILIMVIKIIFSKSVSGSDEYASFINEDVKTYIKKNDTTQRLKKFSTLLPK